MNPFSDPVWLKKKLIKNVATITWFFWGIFALYLLANSSSEVLVAYLAYWLLGLITFLIVKNDLYSPPSICVLVSFLAFGLNIPIFASGMFEKVKIAPHVMANTTWVVVFAVGSFCLGSSLYRSNEPFRILKPLRSNEMGRVVSIKIYVILLLYFIAAAAVRITLHIGEAGTQPTVSFSGYLQFLFSDGASLLSLWFLSQGLQQSRFYMLLGLSFLFLLAVVAALLAWRGAIYQLIIAALGVYWFQITTNKKKPVSVAWLVLLGATAGMLTQLGNTIRAEKLGGESAFSTKESSGTEKILTRSQGTTRLASVIGYFGELTLTNNWLIFELIEQDTSSTFYIDSRLHGVHAGQSHSVGTSGPGGLYTQGGLCAVIFGYFFLGLFYKIYYQNALIYGRDQVMARCIYVHLCLLLILAMTENFNLLTIKAYFAVIAQAYVYDRYLLREKRKLGSDDDAPSGAENLLTRTKLFNVS